MCVWSQEIDQAVQKTRDAISDTRQGADTLVLPLYSSLPHHLQIKAIAPAARHIRRKVWRVHALSSSHAGSADRA